MRIPIPGAERGQASVEMVATLPLMLLAAAICWQLALVGHTAWMAAHAARAGARADVVGADPVRAARSALPRALERGLKLRRREQGGVRVTLAVPVLVPGAGSLVRIGATAGLGARER